MNDASNAALRTCVREIDSHVAQLGWDRPPFLFALAPTADLLDAGADLAGEDQAFLREILADVPDHLTAILQDDLPAVELEELLGRIEFPEQVVGAAISVERVVLPPSAEEDMPADPDEQARWAENHPDRTDVRVITAVLRDGQMWCGVRAKSHPEPDALMQGADLAPGLTNALLATLQG
ncbi:MAG: PPA1309 family protein [Actinomycetaceae bacterium]|nr:PPA1309 family protein [Actinomycetaceae bacterium]MDU0970237.1 PPA1309 family protein [Actinomycetaceae bacterium]